MLACCPVGFVSRVGSVESYHIGSESVMRFYRTNETLYKPKEQYTIVMSFLLYTSSSQKQTT